VPPIKGAVFRAARALYYEADAQAAHLVLDRF
jgi:hypothetical protein